MRTIAKVMEYGIEFSFYPTRDKGKLAKENLK